MLTTAFCSHLWKKLFLPIQLVEKYKQMVLENVQMHCSSMIEQLLQLEEKSSKQERSAGLDNYENTSASMKMTKLEESSKSRILLLQQVTLDHFPILPAVKTRNSSSE